MLLRTFNLQKSYKNRRVVNDVTLTIEPSEIVGLLGRNGAGKTTTFKMIMGIVKADTGKIMFMDNDITNIPVYARAKLGIGYLAQEPSVFQQLTVYDNIKAIAEIGNLTTTNDEIINLLKEYYLLNVKDQMAYTLSGGEKRRLEICRVLMLKPKLILLDEPYSGLDPISVQEIHDIVNMLKSKGIAILLTDHNVRETLTITDRSFIINNGKIIASGNKEEIVNNPAVIENYLGTAFKF